MGVGGGGIGRGLWVRGHRGRTESDGWEEPTPGRQQECDTDAPG
jgi:hypothetical protein